jgi:hypothetical protein
MAVAVDAETPINSRLLIVCYSPATGNRFDPLAIGE